MEGLGIIVRDRFMTETAGAQIIRRPLHQTLMSGFPGQFLIISLMAQLAAHLEMPVTFHKLAVNDIAPIHLFRLNWRRRTRSPLTLARFNRQRLMQRFHHGIIRVAFDTAAFIGSRRGKTAKEKQGKNTQGNYYFLSHIISLLIKFVFRISKLQVACQIY